MRTLEKIISELNYYRRNIVAEEVGIDYSALHRILNNKVDPRYSTVAKLDEFLNKMEAERNGSSNQG
jgi:predicted transcriptional regulator